MDLKGQMHLSHQKVGELNGLWAFAFKLVNLFMPFIVAWCVWATSQLHTLDVRQSKAESWMAQGPRFTSTDADRLRLQILEQVGKDASKNQTELMSELKLLRQEFTDLRILLTQHIATDDKRDLSK